MVQLIRGIFNVGVIVLKPHGIILTRVDAEDFNS
jgi:hypothetical protein